MGQYGFDRACFSVVFLFLLCFIAYLYEANGGTDMEVLACFRPGFFSSTTIKKRLSSYWQSVHNSDGLLWNKCYVGLNSRLSLMKHLITSMRFHTRCTQYLVFLGENKAISNKLDQTLLCTRKAEGVGLNWIVINLRSFALKVLNCHEILSAFAECIFI